ncbi:MAG: DUF5796 family protein [Natrialbaceae archaeon]|nr:DUF5796 family protein [Natrialbaceae archaeon]
MAGRSAVTPRTLEVELLEEGVVVRYLDGREVFYHGPLEQIEGSVRTPPKKGVHVLVTESGGAAGVMTYVNDHDTHDDVLEATGVGRVFADEEPVEVFPGVDARRDGYATIVEADLTAVDGRVFVFAEDEFSEHAYELVTD